MNLTTQNLAKIKQLLNIPEDTTDETLNNALTDIYTHLGFPDRRYTEIIKDILAKYLILEHADNGDYLWYENDATSYAFINHNESEALKQWKRNHPND